MVGMGTLFSDKPKYRFDEYAERWKLVHAQHSVEISRRWKFAVDGQWVDYMPWGPQSLDPDLYPIGCPKRQPQGHRFGPLPSLWGSSYRQRRWAGAECALLPHWGWVKTHDFPYERGMNIDNYKLFNLDLRNRVNWQIAVWRMYCKGFKMFQPIFGSNTRIYIYVITYMYYHGGFSSVRLRFFCAPFFKLQWSSQKSLFIVIIEDYQRPSVWDHRRSLDLTGQALITAESILGDFSRWLQTLDGRWFGKVELAVWYVE